MAETSFQQRTQGDKTTYGYRQLAGTGSTTGPELKTLIVAGLGAALGIVVGTFLGDGSFREIHLTPSHQMVQTASRASAPVSPSIASASVSPSVASGPVSPSVASAQVSPSIASAPISPSVASAPVSASVASAPVSPRILSAPVSPSKASASVSASVASAPVSPQVAKAVQAPPLERQSVQPKSARVSDAQNPAPAETLAVNTVTVVHENLSGEELTAEKPHFARRTTHAGDSLHAPLLGRIPVQMPPGIAAPELEHAADTFAFTVEGDVTVANYDDVTKTIDTYEGETIALAPTASDSSVITWQNFTSNVHYKCDQTGNCTLVKGGQVSLNSTRTK
jgi:hypothetical protein